MSTTPHEGLPPQEPQPEQAPLPYELGSQPANEGVIQPHDEGIPQAMPDAEEARLNERNAALADDARRKADEARQREPSAPQVEVSTTPPAASHRPAEEVLRAQRNVSRPRPFSIVPRAITRVTGMIESIVHRSARSEHAEQHDTPSGNLDVMLTEAGDKPQRQDYYTPPAQPSRPENVPAQATTPVSQDAKPRDPKLDAEAQRLTQRIQDGETAADEKADRIRGVAADKAARIRQNAENKKPKQQRIAEIKARHIESIADEKATRIQELPPLWVERANKRLARIADIQEGRVVVMTRRQKREAEQLELRDKHEKELEEEIRKKQEKLKAREPKDPRKDMSERELNYFNTSDEIDSIFISPEAHAFRLRDFQHKTKAGVENRKYRYIGNIKFEETEPKKIGEVVGANNAYNGDDIFVVVQKKTIPRVISKEDNRLEFEIDYNAPADVEYTARFMTRKADSMNDADFRAHPDHQLKWTKMPPKNVSSGQLETVHNVVDFIMGRKLPHVGQKPAEESTDNKEKAESKLLDPQTLMYFMQRHMQLSEILAQQIAAGALNQGGEGKVPGTNKTSQEDVPLHNIRHGSNVVPDDELDSIETQP